jgi:hypothetical protein
MFLEGENGRGQPESRGCFLMRALMPCVLTAVHKIRHPSKRRSLGWLQIEYQ